MTEQVAAGCSVHLLAKEITFVTAFQVAHIREQGQSLIIILVNSSFGYKTPQEQAQVTTALQGFANQAGLAGVTVPVWMDSSRRMGFFAPKGFLPFFKSITWRQVVASVNKRLTIDSRQHSMPTDFAPAETPETSESVDDSYSELASDLARVAYETEPNATPVQYRADADKIMVVGRWHPYRQESDRQLEIQRLKDFIQERGLEIRGFAEYPSADPAARPVYAMVIDAGQSLVHDIESRYREIVRDLIR